MGSLDWLKPLGKRVANHSEKDHLVGLFYWICTKISAVCPIILSIPICVYAHMLRGLVFRPPHGITTSSWVTQKKDNNRSLFSVEFLL